MIKKLSIQAQIHCLRLWSSKVVRERNLLQQFTSKTVSNPARKLPQPTTRGHPKTLQAVLTSGNHFRKAFKFSHLQTGSYNNKLYVPKTDISLLLFCRSLVFLCYFLNWVNPFLVEPPVVASRSPFFFDSRSVVATVGSVWAACRLAVWGGVAGSRRNTRRSNFELKTQLTQTFEKIQWTKMTLISRPY